MRVPAAADQELQAKKVDDLVSLVDLVPTVLDWHDLKIPPSLTGQSLLHLAKSKRRALRLCNKKPVITHGPTRAVICVSVSHL